MADLAQKAISANTQKEGTRIADVNKQGDMQTLGGEVIPDDGGLEVANTKWGNRSMGNDGLIT